jgi:hypothetical protein
LPITPGFWGFSGKNKNRAKIRIFGVFKILRGFLHKFLNRANNHIDNIVANLFSAKFLQFNANACMLMNNLATLFY